MKAHFKNFLSTGLFLLLFSSCAQQAPNFAPWGMSYEGQTQLRIGISPDYPPLVFKEAGKFQGVEVAMSESLAYDLKAKMIYIELPFDELIPSLVNNKINIIMSGMTITADRQQQVSFAEPYMQVGQMALVRKAEKPRFPNPNSLLNSTLRIGYIANTTSDIFVHRHFSKTQLIAMDSVAKAVSDLRHNNIDIFIHNAPSIWLIADNPTELELTGLYWPLTKEYLAWAVRPTDYNLLATLNNSVNAWKRTGKLQNILDTWIKMRVEIEL